MGTQQSQQDHAWAVKARLESRDCVSKVMPSKTGDTLKIALKSSAISQDTLDLLSDYGSLTIPPGYGEFQRGSPRFEVKLELSA